MPELESRHHEVHTFECGCQVVCEIQLVGLEQTQSALELCPLHSQAEAMYSALGSMVSLLEAEPLSNGMKIEVSLAKEIRANANQ